jgi:hypothetical protein
MLRNQATLLAAATLASLSTAATAAPVSEWLLTLDPASDVFGTPASAQVVLAHDPTRSSASVDQTVVPSAALEVDAFERIDGDTYYFSLDTHSSWAGQTVAPADVLLYDGGTESVFFDASAEGLPDGTDIDAVAFDGNGQLIFSVDTHVSLSGSVFEDADVIVFDGSGFASLIDASAAGFDDAADVDALATLPGGRFVLSFASGGGVAGQPYDDGSLVRLEADGGALATLFSARADLSSSSDIVALGAVPAADLLFSDRFEA